MATFILISGAWHAGWCWERVIPLLESAGHQALAPDLLGLGRDATPLPSVTLARWANQIADLIRVQPEPVVLVGHSRGGIVISEAAERIPERIRTLVYVTAMLLPNGQSLLSQTGGGSSRERHDFIVRGCDGTSTLAPTAVAELFYNTTPPEWIERAVARLGPEPMAVFGTPLRLGDERFGCVPRAYIECAQDRALSLDQQRAMQARLPCDPVVTLQTDHCPFYSAPAELAGSLIAMAALP